MEKNIIIIDRHTRSATELLKGSKPHVIVSSSFKDALSAGGYGYTPEAIVVAGSNHEFMEEQVTQLRQSSVYFNLPVFTLKETNNNIQELTDGVVEDYFHAAQQTHQLQQLTESLPAPKFDEMSEEERLARFLFVRPGRKISPQKRMDAPKLYRYPLLDTFAIEPDNYLLWKQNLIRKQILQNEKMVDRVRMCPACSWAHLYFVDQCPRCSSVDIHEQLFLHCFTCGNVEPQEKFIKQNSMSCPKCHTTLRHLGADYDRAMENYHCHDCSFVFIDPVVVARCLNCEKTTSPDHLDIADIHEMYLSEKGRISVISGKVNDIYEVLDSLNFVSVDYFSHTLNWHIKQALRYKTVQFSLMFIKISNIKELANQQGHSKTLLLVETFANHLRSLIRDTDLSVRNAENSLVLYLPYTPVEGADILKTRLLEQKSKADQSENIKLEIKAKVYTFPNDYIEGENADMIQMRMQTMLEKND